MNTKLTYNFIAYGKSLKPNTGASQPHLILYTELGEQND